MTLGKTPFVNDMFALVWMAFKNLYPDKECRCVWVPKLEKDEDGGQPIGVTTFYDEGYAFVEIVATITVADAVEIFAHELAHVAAGNNAGHGKAWEEAFDKIFAEYNRIGYEMYNVHDAIDVVDGKAYVRENEDKHEPKED